MKSNADGIGCVVVNYRTNDDLERFVRSWVETKPDDVDCWLLIMDVDPLDQSVGAHLAIRHEDVEYTRIDNVGYARACNIGADKFRFGTLAFFNADVVLRPGAIADCVAALKSLDTCAVVGPRQVDDRGRLTAAGILGTEAAPKHRGWLEHDIGQYQDVLSVPTVAGSAMFVNRKIWLELTNCPLFQSAAPGAIGAFLPTPFYYEETFLCYHARSHGYENLYYGLSTVVHNWHSSVKKNDAEDWAAARLKESREMFREACRIHAIPCD